MIPRPHKKLYRIYAEEKPGGHTAKRPQARTWITDTDARGSASR
jgi:hypothetical protein